MSNDSRTETSEHRSETTRALTSFPLRAVQSVQPSVLGVFPLGSLNHNESVSNLTLKPAQESRVTFRLCVTIQKAHVSQRRTSAARMRRKHTSSCKCCAFLSRLIMWFYSHSVIWRRQWIENKTFFMSTYSILMYEYSESKHLRKQWQILQKLYGIK